MFVLVWIRLVASQTDDIRLIIRERVAYVACILGDAGQGHTNNGSESNATADDDVESH